VTSVWPVNESKGYKDNAVSPFVYCW